jgi:hypothetical protein
MATLEPLPDDLRQLLDAERRSEDAPAEARDRVLMRLGGTFGLGVTSAAGGATGPSSPRTGGPAVARAASVGASGAVRLARVAAIFVAGAATGVGGQRAVHHLRAQSAAPAARVVPAPPVPPAPRADRPAALPPPAAPSEAAAPRAHRPAVPTASPVSPEGGDDRLAAERALLEIARAALIRGQADGALAALARHEATFPRGELSEEREGLYVQALVAAHRYDDARARAARFSRKHPRSLFAPAVAEALESIP